jgi:hypothetical protein
MYHFPRLTHAVQLPQRCASKTLAGCYPHNDPKNRQAESLDADFCLLLQPLAAKPGLCTSGIKI